MKEKTKQKADRSMKTWFYVILAPLVTTVLFFTGYADATATTGPTGPSVGGMAGTVTSSFANLAKLITAASYIAGMGFALSAILKFKQHKDNPQQVPIGTPIALLFIAAALIFLPTIFGVANETVFGGSGTIGGSSGTSS